MPIQIIPKEAAKLPLWQNIMFYFSIGLLLSMLSGYGVLYYFTKKATKDFENIENAIKKGQTDRLLSVEKEMKAYRDKIDDFSSLINNHNFSSNFFGRFEDKIGVLEKNIHPNVFFFDMNFDVKGNKVSLSGQTDSLEIVGQQVNLFRNEKMIQSIKLSKADRNKEGKIEFTLDIVLNPTLLKSFWK